MARSFILVADAGADPGFARRGAQIIDNENVTRQRQTRASAGQGGA